LRLTIENAFVKLENLYPVIGDEGLLEHKVSKLRGRGLEYIAQPDVPSAGGLDLLEKRLETITCLLQPKAKQYGLKFPTGMLLWGPPGTGKSLSAKLESRCVKDIPCWLK
jgi:ATP-dependent 26S proteasome regulatory subunit